MTNFHKSMWPGRVSNTLPVTPQAGATCTDCARRPGTILKEERLEAKNALQKRKYSRLSLSRSRRDPLKHFEISVLRHIRVAELRTIPIEQPSFTNEQVFDSFSLKYMLKILWNGGEIAPEEQFLLLSTIFSYLMLDFYVKTRIRFSLRDKRVFRDNRSRDNESPLYTYLIRFDCVNVMLQHC